MPDGTMTIGEMCRAFDVTPRTLRFYEQKELLAPLRTGPQRRYTGRDRARLKLILRGRRFGFSLEEIRELLDLYHVDRTQVTQLSATLASALRHRADLAAKRDEITAALAELDKQIVLVRGMLAERAATEPAP